MPGHESFHDGGKDSTIPSPRMSPENPLQSTGRHDPLHGRQTCSESNFFHKFVGQTCPREGEDLFVPSYRGQDDIISYIVSKLAQNRTPFTSLLVKYVPGRRGVSFRNVLQGTGRHDPLHGEQTCSESNSFHKFVGKRCPREEGGIFPCRPLPKLGKKSQQLTSLNDPNAIQSL